MNIEKSRRTPEPPKQTSQAFQSTEVARNKPISKIDHRFEKLIHLIKNSDLVQFFHRKIRSLRNRITLKKTQIKPQEAVIQTVAKKTPRTDTPAFYEAKTKAILTQFKQEANSDSKIRVLEELQDLLGSYQQNRRQWEDGLSDEEKTEYSQAFNYMLHKEEEMNIDIEATKAKEQEKANQLVADLQKDAVQAADFDFLGPELSGKIKAHLEGIVLWPEPIQKAIAILKNKPLKSEINDVIDLLQIPRNSDLAKAFFDHNFL